MKEEIVKRNFHKIEKLLAKQQPTLALELTFNTRALIKSNQKWFLAKSYFWENLCYKHLLDYKKADRAANKGIKIFKELGDLLEVSKIIRDQGLTQEYLGNYSSSLKKLTESIDVLAKLGSIDALGITLSKIGQIYLHQERLDDAVNYCELGYKICKLGNNDFFLLTTFLPLTLAYYYSGNHIAGLYLIEEAENINNKLSLKNSFVNERRKSEISLIKSLLLFGSNMFNESLKEYKTFYKLVSNSEGSVVRHFTTQKEYIEICKRFETKGIKFVALKITQSS